MGGEIFLSSMLSPWAFPWRGLFWWGFGPSKTPAKGATARMAGVSGHAVEDRKILIRNI